VKVGSQLCKPKSRARQPHVGPARPAFRTVCGDRLRAERAVAHEYPEKFVTVCATAFGCATKNPGGTAARVRLVV